MPIEKKGEENFEEWGFLKNIDLPNFQFDSYNSVLHSYILKGQSIPFTKIEQKHHTT